MALFKKLRKGADEPVAPPSSPAESIEAMRRRARHRLIGAVVLVLAAVIGFPILFDTQPRPVAVDIPIEIPDRNKVKPLQPPAAVAARPAASAAPAVAARPAASAPPAFVARAASAPVAAAPVITETRSGEVVAEPKALPAAEKKPAAAAEDAAKARALLDGKSLEPGSLRYVVQVGAFAEQEKARLAQQKLERAGLKNYTNVAETKDGKRIRVRAGPFTSRAEADKAVEKIKGLDLPAAILTL